MKRFELQVAFNKKYLYPYYKSERCSNKVLLIIRIKPILSIRKTTLILMSQLHPHHHMYHGSRFHLPSYPYPNRLSRPLHASSYSICNMRTLHYPKNSDRGKNGHHILCSGQLTPPSSHFAISAGFFLVFTACVFSPAVFFISPSWSTTDARSLVL